MRAIRYVEIEDTGNTEVRVSLPNEILHIIDGLAKRKGITRTEALVQAVVTTKVLVGIAPHGARVEAM
jgi:hypothetical protein